jgi:hypothetical protein
VKLRIILACCAALALTVGVATATGGNGGNSANAKLCQKGGWQNLVRADQTPFADQDECVAYGATGGTPAPPTPTADISLAAAPDVGFASTLVTATNAGPNAATITLIQRCDNPTSSLGAGIPLGSPFRENLDAPAGTRTFTATLASGASGAMDFGCILPPAAGSVEVFSSSLQDPDSTPNNQVTTEDDYVVIPNRVT